MRSAMREGIVDQRLARLQGRGSERERTESHRHHPIQPPFVHPRPHLSSKPTPAIPSSLVSAAHCLPPFLSFRLFLSLRRSPPVVSFSRHSYLAILETQPRVCLRVRRLCTLIYASPFVHLYRACVRVSSTSELEHVYHRYVYLRKMPKQAHKATGRHEYE